MKKLLALQNIDDAAVKSLALFKKRRPDLGRRIPTKIECMSCQPNLVLASDNVVRGGLCININGLTKPTV